MAGMVFHSAFFFIFSILAWLFGVLLLDEDNPRDKRLLLFAFLVAFLYAVFAAKNLLEASAQ